MIRTLSAYLLSWRLAPLLLWLQLAALLWLPWQGWPHGQLLPFALLLLVTAWLAILFHSHDWRLRQLSRRAGAQAEGSLAERLAVGGNDALGQLAQACNALTAQLQMARQGENHGRHFADMLLQAMPMPVFYKDLQGRYLGCNEAFAHIIGQSRHAIRGKSAEELWGRQLAKVHQQHDDALLQGAVRQDYYGELRDQYGQRRQVSFSKNVFYGDDGKVAGIIGAWNDISELRSAENQLRLLAGVFKHSREGIAVTDARGRFLDANRALCQMSGYEREQLQATRLKEFCSARHDAGFYEQLLQQLVAEGYWQGEVWTRRQDGSHYPVLLSITSVLDDAGTLRNYIAIFTDISILKEQEQRLDRMAHHDALTQLPNRGQLAARMQQSIARANANGLFLAVCVLDLDGFKRINDRYGHQYGDQLLIQVAGRLRDALRGSDTVARLGGDEFALVLTDLPDLEACHSSLQRLLDIIAQPYELSGIPLQLTASIGVALYPQDEHDPDTLLRHADQAMYQVKEQGRNGYRLFDAEHDKRRRSRKESLARLQQALQQGELRLYYQPKVNMRNGKVVGAEALLRWHHPQHGVLAPGAFLADIEDSELDIPLGEWVIRTALAQMQEWRARGLLLGISVNISAFHLQQPDFAQRMAVLLQEYPEVPRDMLEIEVLESTALSDLERVISLMRDCQALGVRFALDDFGTGYSSLLYLKRLPADKLKIDQSFIRNMHEDTDDLAIVQGIIGLSGAFNRHLVAEGVETEEHGKLLLYLGCEVAQGYGIARPMPAENFFDWVRRWQGNPQWEFAARQRWTQPDIALFRLELAYRATLSRLLELAAGDGKPGDWDAASYAEFAGWYLEEGQRGYGQHPSYRELGELLQGIGSDSFHLWQALQQQDAAEVAAKVPELLRMRDTLTDTVRSLLPGHNVSTLRNEHFDL
ncbi:EAL domain-containing protein [Vogesella sp. LIG4]|uniref:bifunctional diguanylate cyclase/phosphodiesterase n=1 Tax=Vogesella sp. LIG4 TaxID=1192162 RepID=UPI00081FFD2E|nr:EAL domain-containing protein [Vogesella sp. LIG4]SCK10548.1 PAS domain S-box-containing protein/diguanylate cyclase (GGDEF) domain-containing protein [Vogesella sp. LIG4]